jgi:hypothetical protein
MHRNESSSFYFQRRFVSEVELDQLTGISRRTWQKHRHCNRSSCYYKVHGSSRDNVEEIVAWIKALASMDLIVLCPRSRGVGWIR